MFLSANVYIGGGDGDSECVDVESMWPYVWVGRHVSFIPIDVSGWFLSYWECGRCNTSLCFEFGKCNEQKPPTDMKALQFLPGPKPCSSNDRQGNGGSDGESGIDSYGY